MNQRVDQRPERLFLGADSCVEKQGPGEAVGPSDEDSEGSGERAGVPGGGGSAIAFGVGVGDRADVPAEDVV